MGVTAPQDGHVAVLEDEAVGAVGATVSVLRSGNCATGSFESRSAKLVTRSDSLF